MIDPQPPSGAAPVTPTLPGVTADRVAVHIDRDDNPFAQMSQEARMRLFIRVLCELVAYGEPTEATGPDGDARVRTPVRPVPAHRRTRATAT